ncbi:MAG: hypothetical protein HY711_03285, partial [Candidatus Melainabacteria bacterium]|nr:hypothetical protein [Candidatus Melainabacteria bacterium]
MELRNGVGASFFLSRLAAGQRALVLLYALTLPLSLTTSWIVLIVGLMLWALAVACSWKLHSDNAWTSSWKQAPLLLPLFAFAVAIAISGAGAGGMGEAVASLWTLKTLVVYFWSYTVFAQDRSTTPLAICSLLTVSALAGIWGTIQQLTGFHPFSYPYLQATGFLGAPMAFAGQMQIFSLLALGLFLTKGYLHLPEPFRVPWVFATLTVANLLGVFFSSERSAWLGVAIGILVLASFISWRAMAKSCLILSVVVATSWIYVPVVKQRLYPLFNWQTDVSTT